MITYPGRPSTHVRWLIRRDMPEVLQMEESLPHPLGEEQILNYLRCRSHIGMVAEDCSLPGEPVLGYMLYELGNGYLHLNHLAVHPRYRRQGVGARLLIKLLNKLSHHRRATLSIELAESNLGGQHFLKALGLRATEVLREGFTCEDYFSPNGLHTEDSYRFEYTLPQLGECDQYGIWLAETMPATGPQSAGW